MNDEILWSCNETELVCMAREQGLGSLRRGIPKEDLIAIVAGERNPRPDEMSDANYTRMRLERFISEHWGRVASQLPGCNGKCRTFKCSEGRHAACFTPNEGVVQ